jgi:hypothetical protein
VKTLAPWPPLSAAELAVIIEALELSARLWLVLMIGGAMLAAFGGSLWWLALCCPYMICQLIITYLRAARRASLGKSG